MRQTLDEFWQEFSGKLDDRPDIQRALKKLFKGVLINAEKNEKCMKSIEAEARALMEGQECYFEYGDENDEWSYRHRPDTAESEQQGDVKQEELKQELEYIPVKQEEDSEPRPMEIESFPQGRHQSDLSNERQQAHLGRIRSNQTQREALENRRAAHRDRRTRVKREASARRTEGTPSESYEHENCRHVKSLGNHPPFIVCRNIGLPHEDPFNVELRLAISLATSFVISIEI